MAVDGCGGPDKLQSCGRGDSRHGERGGRTLKKDIQRALSLRGRVTDLPSGFAMAATTTATSMSTCTHRKCDSALLATGTKTDRRQQLKKGKCISGFQKAVPQPSDSIGITWKCVGNGNP